MVVAVMMVVAVGVAAPAAEAAEKSQLRQVWPEITQAFHTRIHYSEIEGLSRVDERLNN